MRTRTKVIAGVVGVAVLAVAGFLFWFYVLKDDPAPRLTSEDREALFDTTIAGSAATTTAAAADGTTPASASTDDASGTTAATGGASAEGADGVWTISSDSTLGYRVKEVLAGLDTEGVGRTNQVTGSLTIEGTTVSAADFTVDVATITSDEDRRDSQFRNSIMDVAQFPTATFVLTEPIELGAIPSDGETITVSATGELTMHGVTNSVTFDLEAERQSDRIAVLGNIDITFADYDIDNPSTGIAKVGDTGLLEFVLAFDRS